MPKPPPLRIPVDDYRSILEEMVKELQDAGVRTILVAGPENLTPEDRQRLLQSHYMIAGDNAVNLHREYLTALRQAAGTTGADLLDADEIFKKGNLTSLIMRDGIHLTDSGHQMMASLLAGMLRPILSSAADHSPGRD